MIVIPFIIIGAIVITILVILIRMIVAPKKLKQLIHYYKQNRNAAGIKLAKQLIIKDPRNPELHYYLGLLFLNDAKPELALEELKLVNNIGVFGEGVPEIEFRKTIAGLYSRFNYLEEAQKEYLVLIQLDSEEPFYYFEAGRLFELRNQADKAVKFYRKTIELDKRHADAFARLGSILHRAKKIPEAKEALEQAVRLQPQNAQAAYTLGKICKENKDFQNALQHFEKAVKEPDLKQKVLLERGSVYLAMGDNERAELELERLIKGAPEEASNEIIFGRYLLAYIFEQSRRYEEAITQWEKIQAKKPNFRDVAAKLQQYQDFKEDDLIKDYLTAPQETFVDICRRVVEAYGLGVQDIRSEQVDTLEIVAGESQSKWRNQKKNPFLFHFVRETAPIEESAVRAFYEKIKGGNLSKGYFVTSSVFSRGSKEFSESRQLELVDKDKIQALLQPKASGGA